MSASNINSNFFHKMNTWGSTGRGRVGECAGGNQVPPQVPTVRVGMLFKLAGLADVGAEDSFGTVGSSHHCAGSGYDGPGQHIGGLAGEPNSPQHGQHVARFYEDESFNLYRI